MEKFLTEGEAEEYIPLRDGSDNNIILRNDAIMVQSFVEGPIISGKKGKITKILS